MTTVNSELRDMRGRVEKLRKELSTILDQAGSDLDMKKVTHVDGDSATKVAYFQALNVELDECMQKLEPLEAEHAALVRAREQLNKFGDPVGRHPFPTEPLAPMGALADRPRPGEVPHLGKMFHQRWVENGRSKDRSFEIPDVGLKTLFQTAAGWAPENIRSGRLVEDAQRPIQVIDVIPSGETSQAAVVYMEETTFTNAAAEVAESTQATPGTYPEAALALTEQSSPVRKIAVFLPVTDEQLDDVPQVQGYVQNRLPFMLRQRLDAQVLVGDGVAPNLDGFLNVGGVQTQAKGADPTPDAIYKAMTKVRVTGQAMPGTAIVHPNDWQEVRLLRTADGIYLWGSPSDAGPDRIWGIPVVQAQAITEGTALVGDFAAYSELTNRKGIEVKVSDSHGTYFVEGKQAIRADLRVALVVYRPAAFCTVTGI